MTASQPFQLEPLQRAAKDAGFTMMSDLLTGNLLATLASSKPGGRLLELGTGVGLGTAWLLSGMDEGAKLETVEVNPDLAKIAREHLGSDERLTIHTENGLVFLNRVQGQSFDLIFADAKPGKIDQPELALNLVAPGGFYIIDDLNLAWKEQEEIYEPDDYILDVWRGQRQVIKLLQERDDFICTEMRWSTGLMVCTKRDIS